jgi:hypothetical protein
MCVWNQELAAMQPKTYETKIQVPSALLGGQSNKKIKESGADLQVMYHPQLLQVYTPYAYSWSLSSRTLVGIYCLSLSDVVFVIWIYEIDPGGW